MPVAGSSVGKPAPPVGQDFALSGKSAISLTAVVTSPVTPRVSKPVQYDIQRIRGLMSLISSRTNYAPKANNNAETRCRLGIPHRPTDSRLVSGSVSHRVEYRSKRGRILSPRPKWSRIRHRGDSLFQRGDGVVVTYGNRTREHTDVSSGYWGRVRPSNNNPSSICFKAHELCYPPRVMSTDQILTLLEACREVHEEVFVAK